MGLILAANYMDIKSLLHLGCAKIATLIKGKSPEEIKKILGADEDAVNAGKKEGWKFDEHGNRRRRLYQILGLDKLFESDQPDRALSSASPKTTDAVVVFLSPPQSSK